MWILRVYAFFSAQGRIRASEQARGCCRALFQRKWMLLPLLMRIFPVLESVSGFRILWILAKSELKGDRVGYICLAGGLHMCAALLRASISRPSGRQNDSMVWSILEKHPDSPLLVNVKYFWWSLDRHSILSAVILPVSSVLIPSIHQELSLFWKTQIDVQCRG